ncbi:LysR family transcriptional regulator [Microbispora oryzae]|uniref:LysR family transcriptional regulator n=1 Tax=Microbispora oryzae TaxID=2806554 RepID=UPI0027DDB123|nr:LysR family transcriptional regulator [Microbispora oryzae]
MELRQLRVFEAVVAYRTVTDAAVWLGLAPSSVSEQIRTLERSLGVTLFDRGPRGMRLTEAGRRLVPWSRSLLEQAERAREEVTGCPVVLRLGALETIAATHVPGVLARLAERRPRLRVEVRPAAARDDLLSSVAAGELDAALLLDSGGALGGLGFAAPGGGAGLEFADVERVPLTLVADPAHRLSRAPRVTRADLRGERLLVNVPACSFALAGERLLGPGVERVHAGGVAVMLAWAERGMGITLLPEFAVADRLAAGALVRLPLEVPGAPDGPDLALRLVWRAGGEDRPEVRQLLYAASAGARAEPDGPSDGPSDGARREPGAPEGRIT